MQVEKWTDYYGQIRKVQVDEYGNFFCVEIGVGSTTTNAVALDKIGEDFYDTKEEAIKGVIRKLKEKRTENSSVINYMVKEITKLQQNNEVLDKRIKEMEKK